MSIDNNEQQVAEPTVRLCMLRTWPQHFDGYGFNLHAEKSKSSVPTNGNSGVGLPFSGGQFIGKVDRGSPAESAGLREGDRIVQVDGVDIEGETHSKVVARIKQGTTSENFNDANDDPNNLVSRCSLLVVDRRADTYYREKGIRVHSNMGLQILVLRTPEEPTSECLSLEQNTNTSSSKNTNTTIAVGVNDSTKEPNDNIDPAKAENSTTTTLNLNMTAAELRRRLAERKKQDSRRNGNGDGSLDFRKKYEIVDKL